MLVSAFVLLAASAFFFSLLATPLLRSLALRYRLLDSPNDPRKSHSAPVPRIGGAAILLAYIAAFGVLALFSGYGVEVLHRAVPRLIAIGPALLIIFFIGFWDDIAGLGPYRKLLGQLLAAVYVTWNGVHILCLGSYVVSSWIALPLSIVWLIGCTNAFNLIDGLDGLAGSVGFFASITVFVAAFLNNDFGLALATIPLAGALLGFLRYNFNPASVFMGDCGSLSVGFLLGCFSLMWGEKSVTLLGIAVPLIVLAFPLTDTFLALIRRMLRRVPVFRADRGHIHHRLLDLGFSPRQITDLVCVVCVLLAVLAILAASASRLALAAIAMVLAGGCAAVHYLRYIELEALRRIAAQFRHLIVTEMDVVLLEEAIERSADLRGCVDAINSCCGRFGIYVGSTNSNDLMNGIHKREALRWEVMIPTSEGACIYLRSTLTTNNRHHARLVATALEGIGRHSVAIQRAGLASAG
jgi:UDP-GlcNAc:undecaprenyl-phosphate GlcNAc-1-phosphate transferase